MGNGGKAAKREWKARRKQGQSLKAWGREIALDNHRSPFPVSEPTWKWAARKGLVR